MINFRIEFSYPWLLLLFPLALAFTLIPYFRLSKRHRRTRNRITSIALHLIVMALSIATLGGMMIHYEIPNDENEIILLVDVSDTEEQSQAVRDEFVETVLKDGSYDNYKIGVVTFGFDQKYAVPLTYEVNDIYDAYLEAELPDTSATNIASALTYTSTLFNNKETAKIVLITDGKETDEQANNVIRAIAAQGIKVDTAYVASSYENDEVQLIGVEMPDYHIYVDKECTIGITLQSKNENTATIELYDNGIVHEETGRQNVELIKGTQTITFNHTFAEDGLHELYFKISAGRDGLESNNQYTSYMYLEVFDKILILQRADGESNNLVTMLNDQEKYEITTLTISSEDVPASVDELRAYDQIILNNIAHRDMPENFELFLEEYVSVYGGGLFTVGGNDASGEANAYNREDLSGTIYQQILPVQAIDYTPPVGVIVIIDRSGSMSSADAYGDNKLDWAKAGASSCLDALDDRDYFGLMTLDTDYSVILEPTPRTQETKILSAINSIETADGNTVFPGAIDRAGKLLRSLKNVDKRHIVIVTDGEVPTDQEEQYLEFIKSYYDSDGITLSVVGIGMVEGDVTYDQMKKATDLGHGRTIAARAQDLIRLMREELKAPEINEVNIPEEGFHPIVYDVNSPLVQGLERGEGTDRNKLTVTLDGFYGVKVRDTAELILVGDYEVPLYAQWKYGNGVVGSFMCDLNGVFSSNFMFNPNGQQFIKNVVNNLMPVNNIRPKDISLEISENNYTNSLSVDANLNLEAGESVKGQLISMETNESVDLNAITEDTEENPLSGRAFYVTTALTEANRFSRCGFVVKKAGVYKIVLTKYDAEGNAISTVEAYKTLSYSAEYDSFEEETEIETVLPEEALANLAKRGEGVMIEDLTNPWEVYDGFITALKRSFDPRFLFMIVAIVLFLLDIAVRKFKFKWPHELIREYKNKKESNKKN